MPFTVITNKDYFSRKKLNLRKFIVAVYVIYIYEYDRDRLDILSGANCEILLVNIVYLLVKVSNTQYILS